MGVSQCTWLTICCGRARRPEAAWCGKRHGAHPMTHAPLLLPPPPPPLTGSGRESWRSSNTEQSLRDPTTCVNRFALRLSQISQLRETFSSLPSPPPPAAPSPPPHPAPPSPPSPHPPPAPPSVVRAAAGAADGGLPTSSLVAAIVVPIGATCVALALAVAKLVLWRRRRADGGGGGPSSPTRSPVGAGSKEIEDLPTQRRSRRWSVGSAGSKASPSKDGLTRAPPPSPQRFAAAQAYTPGRCLSPPQTSRFAPLHAAALALASDWHSLNDSPLPAPPPSPPTQPLFPSRRWWSWSRLGAAGAGRCSKRCGRAPPWP